MADQGGTRRKTFVFLIEESPLYPSINNLEPQSFRVSKVLRFARAINGGTKTNLSGSETSSYAHWLKISRSCSGSSIRLSTRNQPSLQTWRSSGSMELSLNCIVKFLIITVSFNFNTKVNKQKASFVAIQKPGK